VLVDRAHTLIVKGVQGQRPVILKVSKDWAGLEHEACALRCFKGRGVVQVIAQEDGFLLMECAIPGIPLTHYFPARDQEAIIIAATLMQKMHTALLPVNSSFPHIKDWLCTLDQPLTIPALYLQKARQLRDQLLQTSGPDVLLHGDLHPENILHHGTGWIAIDPKGVIGESAYDVGAFLRNPLPLLMDHLGVKDLTQQRVALFSQYLRVDEPRLLAWCFVQVVLAWAWALEDGDDVAYFKGVVKLLEEMV
jgi:streptomycin 6-kinase